MGSLSIGDSLQRLVDTTFTWLPRLVGALVVVIVTFVVAGILQRLVQRILVKSRVDQRLTASSFGPHAAKLGRGFTPSKFGGLAVRWIAILLGLSVAADVAGIAQLSNGIATVASYIPNVIAAVAILLVGIFVASFVGRLLTRTAGATTLGRIAASAAPILILVLVSFMALTQLNIATPIVTGTFYIVLGAIALAGALAFGLGGREAAARFIDKMSDQPTKSQ